MLFGGAGELQYHSPRHTQVGTEVPLHDDRISTSIYLCAYIRKTRIIGFCTSQYLRLASAPPLLAEISCSAMSRPSVPCIVWAELAVMFPHTQVYPCAHRGYDCVCSQAKIRGLGGFLYVAHHVVCRSHDNASLSFIPGS